MAFAQTCAKLSKRKQKQQEKADQIQKKQYIKSGCGHDLVKNFLDTPVPVTENPNDIAGVGDDTLSGDGIVEGSVENNEDKTESEFVCIGCGNNRNECHQYNFGKHLVHNMITFHKECKSDEVVDFQLEHHFEYKYNKYLKFCCHDITHRYDTRTWYDLPECLKKGSLAYGLKLICWQQIYHHLKKNRVDGIAGKELWNGARKTKGANSNSDDK